MQMLFAVSLNQLCVLERRGGVCVWNGTGNDVCALLLHRGKRLLK